MYSQQLSNDLQTRVTPQMVVASNLLRLSSNDVESLIQRELQENPALEVAEAPRPFRREPRRARYPTHGDGSGMTFSGGSGRRSAHRGNSDGDPGDPMERLAAPEPVLDQLLAQAGLLLSGRDLDLAVYLLQSLNEHGYLDAAPEQYASELGVPCADVQRVIGVLHELEPAGIAARDVRECFLIQCRRLAADGVDCDVVSRILEKAWSDLIRQRWDRVAQKVKISRRAVERAWQFMQRNLYPYPMQMMSEPGDRADTLTHADLIVRREPDSGGWRYTLEVPDAEAFELQVCPTYQAAMQGNGSNHLPADQREWINASVARARMIIAALAQRWATLTRIGEFLLDYQRPFFDGGPRCLVPLTRAELASEMGVHESTISRAIADKTIQLPSGRIIPLGDLFDNSLGAKEAIRQLLAQNAEPLSDREIALRLGQQGMSLARRTVTKYREAMGIPTKQQRCRSARLRAGAATARGAAQ